MKTLKFNYLIPIIGVILTITFFCCQKISDEPSVPFQIKNLTIESYPKVNGSTSTEPLQVLIACKLLGIDYSWTYQSFWYKYTYRLMPSCDEKPNICRFLSEGINHFGTHNSFVTLIEKHADLILTARTSSADELHLADSLGVQLVEVPIALDAFIFVNNIRNNVNSITTKQIQDIYTGNLTNWQDLGGNNKEIQPYQRDRNSGSQELMMSLVMKDLEMINSPDMIAYGMIGLVNRIEDDKDGLGYSVNYYTQYMIRSDSIKLMEVDGIYPDYNSLKNQTYPYTTDVYAVIREDLDKNSNAYKLFKLLVEPSGQEVIKESGYIPYY